MSSLFLSYSSADRDVARRVADELRAGGFATVFLDIDPDQGIRAGAAWEQELYAALRRCEAVIFLCSEASVTSRWCSIELALARSLNRPVIPLRVSGAARHELLSAVQEIDLAEKDAVVGQLTTALRRSGLGPDQSFPWDPTRSPYPGLQPFTAEFAAVFFGREAETTQLAALLEPSLARVSKDLEASAVFPQAQLFSIFGLAYYPRQRCGAYRPRSKIVFNAANPR